MKNSIKSVVSLALIASVTCSLSGCATLFGKKEAPIVLINAPGGIKVTDNGSNASVERVFAHGTATENATIKYFAAGIMVDKKVKKHNLTFEHNGKTASTEVKLRAGINWILLDAFVGGIIGWGIDAATKKWRVAGHKYVDVENLLKGEKSRSQGKLKRIMKRQAKGKE